MKKLLIYLYCCSMLVFFSNLQAAVPTTSITESGKSKFEIGTSLSNTYYKIKNCSSSSCTKENIRALKITASKTHGINEKIDMYYGLSTQLLGSISSGYSFGGLLNYELDLGLRGELFKSNKMTLIAYTQLKYMDISGVYDGDGLVLPYSFRISGLEGNVGVIATINVSNKLSLYSGVEISPFNKINNSYSDYYYEYEDVKRGDKEYFEVKKPTYRLGYHYKINNKNYLNGELTTGGEKSAGIKVGFVF